MVLVRNQKGSRLIYLLLRSSKSKWKYRHRCAAGSRRRIRRWWKYGRILSMRFLFMLWRGVPLSPCREAWSRPLPQRRRLKPRVRSSTRCWRRWVAPARRFWFIFGSRRGVRCRITRLQRSRSWRGRSLRGAMRTEDSRECDEPVDGEAGWQGLLHS